MTANTGRTIGKYITVKIGDSGNTLRTLPIKSIGPVGLDYEQVDLTALADAVKGLASGIPDFKLDMTVMFDNTATTGSHVVLNALNGVNTPRSLDIQYGIMHAWETGEPQFGITQSAGNGILVTSYLVNPDGTASFKVGMYPGSTAPAWGTDAEAGS